MRRVRELKRLLGKAYSYKRYLTERDILRLKRQVPKYFTKSIVASLTAGSVKIDAVLFKGSNGLALGYDVFVKDDMKSPEWICYDNPIDEVVLKEKELLAVLDKIVVKNNLSYTECCFERLNGKEISAMKKKSKIDIKGRRIEEMHDRT